tara:strand:+ start:136 stop:375 length:240 start_codon:yes stop_codon:yes gene_type:complete
VTKFQFSEDQYAQFRASSYMGILYENKCSMTGLFLDYYGKDEHAVEFSEGIDIDVQKDVYIPFLKEYYDQTLNNQGVET